MSVERAEGKLEGSIVFDQFELDATRGQLRRGGVAVDLSPQALRVLGILAEHPDELVTRKEMKDALWPGETYGDFDSRLNFTIKKLREALGDDAEQPRYVQTVRNAGYRFVAPLRELRRLSFDPLNSARQSVPPLGNMVAHRGFRLSKGGLYLAIVAVALIAVAAAAVFALRQGKPGRPGSAQAATLSATANVEYVPHIDSVTAVLPRARQRIVIIGRGFGLHVPYVHTDSPYLAIRDLSAHWAAGRIVPQNSDEVMVDVESWSDTEIVISGFSGDYGVKGWALAPGDDLEVVVWNPQSGAGPGLYQVRVGSISAAR